MTNLEKRANILLEMTSFDADKKTDAKVGTAHMKIRTAKNDLRDCEFEMSTLTAEIKSLKDFESFENLSDFDNFGIEISLTKKRIMRLETVKKGYLKIYASLKKSCDEIEKMI